MIVVTKRFIYAQELGRSRYESLTLHLNNKKIWDNWRDGLPHPYTKENARCFISQAREKPEISDFCIVVHGEAIGNIGFVRSGWNVFQCGSWLLDQ